MISITESFTDKVVRVHEALEQLALLTRSATRYDATAAAAARLTSCVNIFITVDQAEDLRSALPLGV